MRTFALLCCVVTAAAAAGCGGASPEREEAAAIVEAAPPTTVASDYPAGSIGARLAERPGDDVALVLGTADFAVGENRISFLVVDPAGALVGGSSARVLAAPGGLEGTPVAEGTAEHLPVGAALDDEFDTSEVWVAHLELDRPGPYTLLVEPEGSDLQAVGSIEVAERSAAPAVGAEAIPSDTPTLEDGFPEDLTTASPPDVELLRHSVADSLEDGVPFVVTFATPKYCQSRVCGPVVEVVDRVRERLEGAGVRFIHVEIYEGNDPSRGFNRWVREWNLPTEPYTFLVGADGRIRARFEGLVTVGELEQAVRDHLL